MGVHYSFDSSQELGLLQVRTAIPQYERSFWKNTPPPWNSRPWKHFVLKLQRSRFQTIIPRVLCLRMPGLLHWVLSGSSTVSAALQGGEEPGAQGNPGKRLAHIWDWLRYGPTAHEHHGRCRVLETGSTQALQQREAGGKTRGKATARIRRVHPRDRASNRLPAMQVQGPSKGGRDGQTNRQTGRPSIA